MRPACCSLLLILASVGAAAAAPPATDDRGKDESDGDEGEQEERSSSTPPQGVKVGGAQVGAVVGGATDFEFKQGLFLSAELGPFFRVGGFAVTKGCAVLTCPTATSQAQPFIGLNGGYDVAPWLALELSFGIGFVANAAPYAANPNSPRDYGITTLGAAASFALYLPAPFDRVALTMRPFGGVSLLTPEPDSGAGSIGGDVGVGVGVTYATLLPNTFVGVEWNTAYVLTPAKGAPGFVPMGLAPLPENDVPGIIAFSFAPMIKYVF